MLPASLWNLIHFSQVFVHCLHSLTSQTDLHSNILTFGKSFQIFSALSAKLLSLGFARAICRI